MNIGSVKERAMPRVAPKEVSEWWFVTVTIVLVLLITSIPYLYAYLSTPPDKQFMGIMVNVPDHVQYFSWMRELTTQHLAANKLTPEPNEPVFFNLLWWGMGRLGQLLGVGYAAMFQLLRFAAASLFLLLVYRLCAWLLEDRFQRRLAFILVVFGAGFGWGLILLRYTVTDGQLLFPLLVYISEPNTFLNILAVPHFIAAALYIFVFDLVLRGQARNDLRYALGAGLVALFLGWQHAYDLILVYGILGSYALLLTVRERRLPIYMVKSGLIIGLISWWPALYSVFLTTLDPLWKEVLAQFANAGVYTPNLVQLPILMGPTFLLALFTVARDNPFRLRGVDNLKLFLRAWFLGNFLLIYVPTDYQIHMLNGWQVPIAILATQGLFRYILPAVTKLAGQRQLNWPYRKIQYGLAGLLVLLAVLTNLYLFSWRFIDLQRHDYPYYLHQEEVGALAWLESEAGPNDVVFSSLTIGQYIPALTGTHAFLAHWAQTVDFYGKSQLVNEFFNRETEERRRREILNKYGVDYIFYGPVEQSLGDYELTRSPLAQPVYSSSQVQIYRVVSQQ